jgi:hypothetical protein
MKLSAALTLSACGLLTGTAATADDAEYSLSGSFKSLWTASETPVNGDQYWSDINRLKLDLDAKFNDVVSAKVIVDNEFLVGTIIDTEEFQFAKELESNTRWDLDNLVVDDGDFVWRAAVYRAFVKLAFEKANVIAGRQRIAWGTGRIWNPTDLFNPISPLQIEQSQRVGVDALSAEYFFGDLGSVSIVYALGDESNPAVDRDSAGLRIGTNIGGYDIGIMGGEFRDDEVIGFDFGGNIGDAGFRGEATLTDPDQGSSFARVVLSADYSWPNSLYLLIEYLHNGGNLGNSAVSDAVIDARQRFFDGEIVTRNKNFVATGVGYELTPLIRLDGLAIYDLEDDSVFVNPAFGWNILTNLDLALGAQFFAGDADSEYGDSENLYYASLKIFF